MHYYYQPTLSLKPPKQIDKSYSINQFTEGDLHGNAIRLLEALYYYRFLKVDQGALYENIVTCYSLICEKACSKFNKHMIALLRSLKFEKSDMLSRWIGDIIADRGANDTFNLILFDKLIDSGANVRVLLSNHDIEGMKCLLGAKDINEVNKRIEENQGFFAHKTQGQSFLNMIASIKNKEISFEEVQAMSNKYFSKILLLDYSIDSNNRLEIYSHAPINLKMLADLGEQFQVPYPGDESGHKAIMAFIDKINHRFRAFVQLNDHKIIDDLFKVGDSKDPSTYTPAAKIIWSRERICEKTPSGQTKVLHEHEFIDPRYDIINTYGHDLSLTDAEVATALVHRIDNGNGKQALNSDGSPTSISSRHTLPSKILSPITESDTIRAKKIYNGFKYKLNAKKLSSKASCSDLKSDLQEEALAIHQKMIDSKKKGDDVSKLKWEKDRINLLIEICIELSQSNYDLKNCAAIINYENHCQINAWTGLPKEQMQESEEIFVGVEEQNRTNQQAELSPLQKNREGITVRQLKNILDKYEPQSWLRFIARYSFGLFFESFKYSFPVLQLHYLCKQKKDLDVLNEDTIKQVLKETCIWDFQFEKRTSKLENPNLFYKKNSQPKAKLNTDEIIDEVLSELHLENTVKS